MFFFFFNLIGLHYDSIIRNIISPCPAELYPNGIDLTFLVLKNNLKQQEAICFTSCKLCDKITCTYANRNCISQGFLMADVCTLIVTHFYYMSIGTHLTASAFNYLAV